MQKLKLSVNWFFALSAIVSYLLGIIIASWSGRPINLLALAAGLIIFSALYLLQVLQRFLTSNRINPFTRVRSGGQNQSSTALTLIIGAYFVIFAGLYLLLQAQVLIGINLQKIFCSLTLPAYQTLRTHL